MAFALIAALTFILASLSTEGPTATAKVELKVCPGQQYCNECVSR